MGAGCTTATPDLAGQTSRYCRPWAPGTKPVFGGIPAQLARAGGPAVAAEEVLRANSYGDEGEIAAVAGAAVAAVAGVA